MNEAKVRGDWEKIWAPYDEPTYLQLLDEVRLDDVVLDIGAGDFRLAYRLAERANFVYAIEVDQDLVAQAFKRKLPENLSIIQADAYRYPFPSGITLGVLLMRHCQRFLLVVDKLARAGCRRLITNARWGFGTEVIDLQVGRVPFYELTMGWYACWCGTTGFLSGPAESLTHEIEETIIEVCNCPACQSQHDSKFAAVPIE